MQCFGEANQWVEQPDGWSRHLAEACRYRSGLPLPPFRIAGDISSSPLPTWTGEFSLATTDCQEYLQGGFVTPYDPPQSSDRVCRSDCVLQSDVMYVRVILIFQMTIQI